ncbi:MAG: hypothetical protein HZA36_00185 [Parcubacteria group bacterium]|nr:hypothetical protein [Parcubacteria group bacterium]
MIEKVLIPLGAVIVTRYQRFGAIIIRVAVGEEDVWISYLKQNVFIADVSRNQK